MESKQKTGQVTKKQRPNALRPPASSPLPPQNPTAPIQRSRWLTVLNIIFTIACLATVIFWSSDAFFRAAYASYRLDMSGFSAEDLENASRSHNFRRNVQKHYLRYGLYIPLEDIITVSPTESHNRLSFLMRKACGEAKLYIWVPLRFQMPFAGSKILEWCWKPSLKKT